jgi:hypothetical protein
LTAPKVIPSTRRRRRIIVASRIGATVTVAAAVRLPYCVPCMLVNALIPTGAVLAGERVSVSANRNSLQASMPLRRLAATIPGMSSGSTMWRRMAAWEVPSTSAASSI